MPWTRRPWPICAPRLLEGVAATEGVAVKNFWFIPWRRLDNFRWWAHFPPVLIRRRSLPPNLINPCPKSIPRIDNHLFHNDHRFLKVLASHLLPLEIFGSVRKDIV